MPTSDTRSSAKPRSTRTSRTARSEGAAGGAPALPASRRVLLLVDFINPLDFDGAAELAGPAFAAARAAAQLRRRLTGEGVPVIYVNDNFGRWRSDFRDLLAHCRSCGEPARRIAQAVGPQAGDLTVLKPRHSAFFATPLELLLRQIGARELVITGLATDRCVLLSAADAFVRGFRLWVPSDCCAAESESLHDQALAWMRHTLRARTRAAL